MTKKSITSIAPLKLKNVTASFVKIAEPVSFLGQAPKYELTALLDPSNAAHAAMIAEIKTEAAKLIKEMWPEGKPEGLRLPFGLADNHPKKKAYDGYAGMFWLAMSLKAKQGKPTIVGRDNKAVVPGDKQYPYSGCVINTNPTLWTYDHPAGGPGMGANLRIVQFVKDGRAFSGNGNVSAEDEFEAIGDAPGVVVADEFDL